MIPTRRTRIIVVGSDAAAARLLADALARDAFDNVAFFRGTVAEALAAIGPSEGRD